MVILYEEYEGVAEGNTPMASRSIVGLKKATSTRELYSLNLATSVSIVAVQQSRQGLRPGKDQRRAQALRRAKLEA